MLADEAEAVWRDWHPWVWRIIKARGYLGGAPTDDAAPRREGFFRRLLMGYL